MNDENNTIDRGEADVTAFDLLNVNPNAATPFTKELLETYALEDKIDKEVQKTQGLARFITGLPLETAGLAKSVLERGPATFFEETFGGAISGEAPKGEITLSIDELRNVPGLYQYLQHANTAAHNELRDDHDTFAKDLEEKYDVDNVKDAILLDLLDEDELIKYEQLFTAAKEEPDPLNPIAYKYDANKKTITLDSDLFPEIAWEPDMKFTKKGDLSLPYFGLVGYNDEGEFIKKHGSAFRPFDESEEGLGQYSEYIPEFLKSWQEYSMPEYSPDPELFKDPGWQMGAALVGGRGIVPIAKVISKGGKNIYKGIGKYFDQSKPVPITKQEPHFSELPWSR